MLTRILQDYLLYQREIFPFNPKIYNQFEENIIDFWESAKGLAPELSRLALQLFGICVNTTSVECLWSNMGFLHLKCQNQLHVTIDTEELEEISIIDDCNVNDTFEEYDNNNILNPEQWTKIIESWIEMVNTENDSNNLDSREVEPYDSEVGRHDTHPADNPLVKW
ncbi:unnamed protein product [Rhizophagus irregularis]|nr:unnamed protein product [Rhizophagus irregularis]